MLTFEPPDWRALLGTEDKEQTHRGVIACNLAGPRRLKAGAARDHVLGFHAVNGRGELFKSGGKVVKNVTGYDLSKLIAGSYGTLTVLTEVTVKVLPRAETGRTVLLLGLDDAAAIRALTAGLNSEHEVSGAAHMPAAPCRRGPRSGSIAAGGNGGHGAAAGGACALRRLSLPGLRDALTRTGRPRRWRKTDTERLWREIRDVRPLVEPRDRPVWRISVAPASGPGGCRRHRATTLRPNCSTTGAVG